MSLRGSSRNYKPEASAEPENVGEQEQVAADPPVKAEKPPAQKEEKDGLPALGSHGSFKAAKLPLRDPQNGTFYGVSAAVTGQVTSWLRSQLKAGVIVQAVDPAFYDHNKKTTT